MAFYSQLPELVVDSKSRVEIHESVIHIDTPPEQPLTRSLAKGTWEMTEPLGKGASQVIWVEECDNTAKKGQLRATKLLRKRGRFDYHRELEHLVELSRDATKYERVFVNLPEWNENRNSTFIVLEHMMYGNLASRLHGPLPEDEAKQITAQILDGLAFLHANELVHGDLKPEKIFVASKGPMWRSKIGDFETSKYTIEHKSLRSVAGKQKYSAPEVLGLDLVEKVDNAAKVRDARARDMWSLGLTVFAMLCHEYPFKNGQPLSHIKGALFLSVALSSLSVGHEGRAFVAALLNVDNANLLSAAVAIKHSWLTDSESPPQPPTQISENISSNDKLENTNLSPATNPSNNSPMDSPRLIDDDAQSSRTLHPQMSETFSSPTSPTGTDLVAGGTMNRNATILDGLREFHDKGVSFTAKKEYGKAEFMLRQAIDGRKAALGLSHKETLASMQQLGIVYVGRGRFSDAQNILQETADAQKHILGETDQSALCTNYWLSKALFEEGKLRQAHSVLDETTETQKFVLGLRHEDTLQSLYLGGQIYLRQEDYGAALPQFRHVADAWKDILGASHPLTLDALQSLGYCLHKKQRHEEACAALHQVVEASNSQLALTYLHETGKALQQAGDHVGAQAALEQVLERRKKLLGADNDETLETLFWLCSSLCDQDGKISEVCDLLQQVAKSSASKAKKELAFDRLQDIGKSLWYREDFSKAQLVFEEAVLGRSKLLGPRHQGTLASRYWLARTVFMQGKYEKAKELLEKIELVQEALLGSDHLDTIYSRMTLTQILVREGGLYAAVAPMSQLTDTLEQILGPTHLDTIICKHDYGKLLTSLQKFKRANAILQEILTTVKEALGPKHEQTLHAHLALGINFYEWGQYTEAAAQFHLAAGEQMSNFGKHDRKTLETLFWIGRVLYAQKRYQECEGFWKQVADARRRLLGMKNLDTQIAITWLAYSLEKQRKWSDAAELHKQVLEARQNSLGPSHEATMTSSQDVKRCQKQSSSVRWPWRKK